MSNKAYVANNSHFDTPAIQQFFQAEIDAFNNQFNSYCGYNKTKAEVISLIDKINTHNRFEIEVDRYGIIALDGINDVNDLKNGKHYNIEVKDYYSNGAIKTISIQEGEQ